MISIISLSASAKTTVVFLNGITNETKESKASAQKLKELMISQGYTDEINSNQVTISYWNNPTSGIPIIGFIDDATELALQAEFSNNALATVRVSNASLTQTSAEYKNALGKIYFDKIASGAYKVENNYRIFSVVKAFSTALLDRVNSGDKVIVVAHSQGNFFTEAVDAYLRYSSPANIQKINQQIRFVGAASVAASTPNGRYISLIEDKALNTHQSATALMANFSLLPRNAQVCDFDIAVVVCNLGFFTVDLSGHGFNAVYAALDVYDKVKSKSMGSILVDFIRDSITELGTSTSVPLTVLSALQAGTYDYSTDMQCYYKNLLGSAVGTNEYTTSAIKYCLNLAQNGWDLSPNYAGLLLYPNGTWGSGNNPNIVITGNTTFTANYGGYAFQNGSLAQNTVGSNYPSGSTSAAISVVDTRDRYILFNNISYITTLDGLISTWNSSFNGQATLSRGSKYGWSFVTPPVTDYTAGIYKLYDISQNSTCTTTGTGTNAVTTCGRPVLAQGAWTKNTLSDGSPSIELNVYSPYTDLLLFGNTGERALYVKRAVDIGVREGVRRISGGVHSFNAVNRTYMNADLAARKTSNGNTYPATVN